MSKAITPTVGRIVYFTPSHRTGSSDFTPPNPGEPLAAIIAAVLPSGALNLSVFDALGHPHARLNVPLVQADEEPPEDGYWACWMPYQLAQAGIKPVERAIDRFAGTQAPASTGQAPKVEQTRIDALMASLTYDTAHLAGTTSTVATARLPGGFVVAIGHSATVNAANFDAAKGRQYAIESAERKARAALWEMEGYALFLRMEQIRAANIGHMPAHQQRVVLEQIELKDRIAKLYAFLTSDKADVLVQEERMRMHRQHAAMTGYADILAERIAAFPVVSA